MTMSRRFFIKGTAVAGGGLALGFSLSGCSPSPWPHASDEGFQPNAFLQICPDSRIIFQLHRVEMGQGNLTGMAMLIAEELGVDPAALEYQQAPVHKDFYDPEMRSQTTGGSAAMRNSFIIVSTAAATAREMILTAASAQWQAPKSEMSIVNGQVTWGERSASLGEFAEAARSVELPETPALKSPDTYTVIGRPLERLDAHDKSCGRANFGVDLDIPDSRVAVIRRCPHFGGTLESYDDSRALALGGVDRILALNDSVAVIAGSYWQATRAADAIDIQWNPGPNAQLSSGGIENSMRQALETEAGAMARDEGSAPQGATRHLEAEYYAPLLAHAAMEPLSLVASYSDGACTVWGGNQVPDLARSTIASALGIPRDKVTINNTLLGGSFGRRLNLAFNAEAALLSRAAGHPVHVFWSREEDTRHDNYRPVSMTRVAVDIDEAGSVYWHSKTVSPSLLEIAITDFTASGLPQWAPSFIPGIAGKLASRKDSSATEGIHDKSYSFARYQVEFIKHPLPVPTGFWRSVGHSQNAFVMETFVDHIATTLAIDPVEYRRSQLADDPIMLEVLERAAAMSHWGENAPGRFKGVAIERAFKTEVAQVVEISLSDGKLQVHNIWCAVNCGLAVNPDIVIAQIEGGIIFGLTAALYGEITVQDGAVEQSNFHDYPLLRMNETPEITVEIIASDDPPSGVGEPGVPPVAPALANAIFAANGERLRRLPLQV